MKSRNTLKDYVVGFQLETNMSYIEYPAQFKEWLVKQLIRELQILEKEAERMVLTYQKMQNEVRRMEDEILLNHLRGD